MPAGANFFGSFLKERTSIEATCPSHETNRRLGIPSKKRGCPFETTSFFAKNIA
jgi:hypothetical protein